MKKNIPCILLLIFFTTLFSSCKKGPVELDYGPFNYGPINGAIANGAVVIKFESSPVNKIVSMSKGMQIVNTGSCLTLNGGGEITFGIRNFSVQLNGGGVTNSANPGTLYINNLSIGGNAFDVDLKNLSVDSTLSIGMTNTGQCVLAGHAGYLSVSSNNLTKVFAFDLITDSCYVSQSSLNQVQVNATQKLKGVIMGSGELFYKGSPPVVNVSQIGSGQLIPY
jgi:hypothetical protein